jgi:Zn-dependent M16 (insulinase) family peptidase
MSQAATSTPPGKYSKTALTNVSAEVGDTPPQDASGQDIALHVLESTLIGGEVSPQTNQLIHKQISEIPTASSTDTLNVLTALVMGSPEFQLR